MKSEKFYDDWKKQRSQIGVGQNFTEKVMNQVYQYEQKKRKPLFDVQRLVEFISAHPLAKAGLITSGTVVGFIRVVFIIHILLFGN
jgi:hypothetical protein